MMNAKSTRASCMIYRLSLAMLGQIIPRQHCRCVVYEWGGLNFGLTLK